MHIVKRQIIDSNNEPHSLDLWNFTLAVNLTGTFNLTRLALKHLVTVLPEGADGERGIIVFVASSAAVSSPLYFVSAYFFFHLPKYDPDSSKANQAK
jgi:NAD(P)-dependent dehydrogenase (short-subunit alcohol dehydrogenase family)